MKENMEKRILDLEKKYTMAMEKIETIEAQLAAQGEKIGALEIQTAEMRGLTVARSSPGMKVNQAAFKKAVAALIEGDRGKALREYRKYYRTPSESAAAPVKIFSPSGGSGATLRKLNGRRGRPSAS